MVVGVISLSFTVALGVFRQSASAATPKPIVSENSRPSPSPVPATSIDQPPNGDTFLGTVAQLSGTVAAILGGFVLAALLGISAERNSMVELLKERERSVDTLSKRLDEEQERRALSLRRLLTAWLRAAYRQEDEAPGQEEVLRRISDLHLGVSTADAISIADEYLAGRRQADAAIRSSSDEISVGAIRTFDLWFSRHSVGELDLGLLKDAFDRIVESIERQERLRDRTQRAQGPRGVVGNSGSSRGADLLTAAESGLQLWVQGPDAVAMRSLTEDLDRAKEMKVELAGKLSSMRLPSHLGLGIVVFCFSIVTGVIYPLCMMPSTNNSFTPTVDLFIKSCFAVQMASIVVYIWMVARSIRH